MRYINLDRFKDDDTDTISGALGFPSPNSMLDSAMSACGTFIADNYKFIWGNYSDDEIIALWNLCLTLTNKNYAPFLLVATNNVGLCKGAAANGFVTLPIVLEYIPKETLTQLIKSYKETVGA